MFQSLPPLIGDIIDEFSRSHAREVVLASVLAALSACLPSVRGRYAQRWYGAQLLIALIAPAGTGKGEARYGKRLTDDVDERLRQRAREEWEIQQTVGSDEGEPPVDARLRIPADASAAGFVQFMNAADWPVLMVESELDTIVALLGNEWGQILHLLRKCAEHEAFSVQRKGGSLHVERPELAMLLAGTPGQFLRLVPSAEDGFFSRVAWFYLPAVSEWMSPRPQKRASFPEETVDRKAAEVDALHQALADRDEPLEVKLGDEHWARLDDLYSTLKDRVAERPYGSALHSVIHRSGVIAFRLAMTLTVVRQMDQFVGVDSQPDSLVAADVDFEAALALAFVFLDTATRLYGRLPAESNGTNAASRNSDALDFYQHLPDVFTRGEAVGVGEQVGVAERTVDKYLALHRDSGQLVRQKRGQYAKPGHEGESLSSSRSPFAGKTRHGFL